MKKIGAILSLLVIAAMVFVYNTRPLEKDYRIRPKPRNVGLTMDEFRVTEYHSPEFEEQLRWLALNIYFEARGEETVGQEAVAWVTLNRVASKWWPNSIKAVVKQKYQFSWYNKRRIPRVKNIDAWRKAQQIARSVANQYVSGDDPSNNADHYHANYVRPTWAKSSKQVTVIGIHKFYDLY